MAPPYPYCGCFKVKVKLLKNSNLIDSIFVKGDVGLCHLYVHLGKKNNSKLIKALSKYYSGMKTKVSIYISELASYKITL